jgi:hypothetical protein
MLIWWNMKTWEKNVLEVHDVDKLSSLSFCFDFIKFYNGSGNFLEFGVGRCKSIIATGCLLKEKASISIIYGFDTFEGFPGNSYFDKFALGVMVYIDDYHSIKFSGPIVAVNEFCQKKNISPVLLGKYMDSKDGH